MEAIEQAARDIAEIARKAQAGGASADQITKLLEGVYLAAAGQLRTFFAPAVADRWLAELHASIDRELGGKGLAAMPVLGRPQ